MSPCENSEGKKEKKRKKEEKNKKREKIINCPERERGGGRRDLNCPGGGRGLIAS